MTTRNKHLKNPVFKFYRFLLLLCCQLSLAFAAPPDFTGIWERRLSDGSHESYFVIHQQGDTVIVIRPDFLNAGNIVYVSYTGSLEKSYNPDYQYYLDTHSINWYLNSYLYSKDTCYWTFTIFFKSEDEADTGWANVNCPEDDMLYPMVRIFH